MKQRKFTLLSGIIVPALGAVIPALGAIVPVCLIAVSAFGQPTSTETTAQKPSYVNSRAARNEASSAVTSEPASDEFAPNFDSFAASPADFIANHPRLAKAMKFLNDESFRENIEKPMTSADKQTIESTVVDAKNNIEALKGLKPQFKAARASGDTAQMHALFHTARPEIKQLRADRKLIIAIIAKYKNANTTTSGQLLDPVYPNPVTVGGAPATISYHIANDGPVNITITGASGNIVKQISNQSETAGDHTITVGSEAISHTGTYYVKVQSGNATATQKVAAVQ